MFHFVLIDLAILANVVPNCPKEDCNPDPHEVMQIHGVFVVDSNPGGPK